MPRVQKFSEMKLTKAQLKEIVKGAIQLQLNEIISPEADRRMRQLDNIKILAALSSYELLEDILEQLDESTWEKILKGLKFKYAYRT